jgi:hypothetical protein
VGVVESAVQNKCSMRRDDVCLGLFPESEYRACKTIKFHSRPYEGDTF